MATAGKVDFPAHMKTIHQEFLDQTGTDSIDSSMIDAMNAALGGSPYGSMTAHDPATELTAMDTAVAGLNTLVDALDYEQDWEDAVDAAVAKADGAVFDDTYITNDITAFGDNLDDQIENIVLPRFHGGMRDVNAVMSSAFVLGESIIEGMRDRDVAKYGTDLRVKWNFQRNDFVLKGTESMLRDMVSRIEMEKGVTHYTMEANRLRIVSEKEKKDTENSIDISDGRWDIETFQYGANLLASIGGGVVVPRGNDSPSKSQSAIGGALAGAAMGASVGGGWGAAIGGVLGGLSSIL
jgi:hypothetical protein